MQATKGDDRSVGSFTEIGPWVVDPAAMAWRKRIDELRVSAAEKVPQLIRRRRLPPSRGGRVVLRLARAAVPVLAKHRRHAKDQQGLPPELAVALRPAFERLGPTFIKLGQLIASGEGMLPAGWVEEFRKCRDQVPPESFKHVSRVIEQDFGRSVSDIFESFDPEPIAAASIAQVHAARLKTGQDVVVKVQRPGVDKVVARDIATLAWLAPIIKRKRPEAGVTLPSYIEMFASTIVEELDFRLEAENMLDVAAVLAAVEPRTIVVPRPHPQLVTRRVLVMERLNGYRLDDETQLQSAGIDPTPVFRALMVALLEGAMVHGVFHGDLHAGNMFVDAQGRPAIFDFGITGRLSSEKRSALLGLVFCNLTQDGRGFLRHFRDLGALPADTDIERLAREIEIDDLFTLAPAEISAEELAQQLRKTVNLLVAHGTKLPKEMFLFIKGFVYLAGAVSRVAADVDLIAFIGHIAELFTRSHNEALTEAEIRIEALQDTGQIANSIRRRVGIEDRTMTVSEARRTQGRRVGELLKVMKRQ